MVGSEFFDVRGIDLDHGLGLATFTVEIELANGRCLAPPTRTCIFGYGLGIAEDPQIFQKNSYYLTLAEGGTDECHQQRIRRSLVGPLGPRVDAPEGVNPILWNGDNKEVRCTRHLDFVEAVDGDWIAIFLGVRVLEGSVHSLLGRETFLAPVEWRAGWPVVNGGMRISLEMQLQLKLLDSPTSTSLGSPVQHLRTSRRDDFRDPDFQLRWYHLRTLLKREYSLEIILAP